MSRRPSSIVDCRSLKIRFPGSLLNTSSGFITANFVEICLYAETIYFLNILQFFFKVILESFGALIPSQSDLYYAKTIGCRTK